MGLSLLASRWEIGLSTLRAEAGKPFGARILREGFVIVGDEQIKPGRIRR
ncbi:MAG TPA: hypothetical protein VGG51_04660 [Candidatus Cybelea sp.]|jgi:hypothetical protein